MDVEARMLLYTVALGAMLGIFVVVRRRAFSFWAHLVLLTVLLAASLVGLFHPPALQPLAIPAFVAFLVFQLLPSLLLTAARRFSRARRQRAASILAFTASAILGAPAPIRRETLLYFAMAAAEAGDHTLLAARLGRLARLGAIPVGSGGSLLADVLPVAVARRWEDVLDVLDRTPARGGTLLAIEARAAAETGDFRRALRACGRIAGGPRGSVSALGLARRAVLAAAGRSVFLAEAAAGRLPVMDGPPLAADLARARAHEASGDLDLAAEFYRKVSERAHGSYLRDAETGLERCRRGNPRRGDLDELEISAVLDLEAVCRAQVPRVQGIPFHRAAPFTLWFSVVTIVVSVVAWVAQGTDLIGFLASGALSAPLVRDEGQWWRLGTTMLLHVGVVHLVMNISCVLVVGIPLERRIGSARTAVVYLASGFLASLGSVYLQGTDVGVGASGAALGLVGGFGALLLRRGDLFAPQERKRWLNVIWMTLVSTLAIGLVEAQAIDNVAHGAGLLAGALVSWLLMPGSQTAPAHRAFRRLSAVLLTGAVAVSVAMVVLDAGSWRGVRSAATPFVSVDLPRWLRVTERPDGSLLARRPPVGLAVQVGRLPGNLPDVASLVPGGGPWRLFAAGPTTSRTDEQDGVRVEEDSYVDRDADPDSFDDPSFRILRISRGGAFAIVYAPVADDPTLAAPTIERIVATLRSVR